jgi:hypothetical protein
MVETYFTIKTVGFFIIIGVLAAVIIVWILTAIISGAIFKVKIDYLKKQGYERYLDSVPSVGVGATYSYRKRSEKHYDYLLERDIEKMRYKELK